MHLSEFKAWFLGYTEEMKGPPSAKQWAKICKNVKEISSDYTPAPVFIDRWIRPYWPYYQTCGTSTVPLYYSASNASQTTTTGTAFLSAQNFTDAGRAEYKAELND